MGKIAFQVTQVQFAHFGGAECKFNPSDLEERAFWDDYQQAYEDAINRCATKHAPWYIVRANRKWSRNPSIVELVLRILKKMDPRYPRLSFDPKTITID